jgi:hypothetical protein
MPPPAASPPQRLRSATSATGTADAAGIEQEQVLQPFVFLIDALLVGCLEIDQCMKKRILAG